MPSTSRVNDMPSFNLIDEVHEDEVMVDAAEPTQMDSLDTLIHAITSDERIKELEAELKKALEAEKKAAKELEEANNKLKNSEKKVEEQIAEINNLRLDLKDTQKSLNDVQKELNAKIDSEQEQMYTISAIRGKKDELEATTAILEDEKKRLKEEIESLQLNVDASDCTAAIEINPIQTHYPEPSSLVRHVKGRSRAHKVDEQYTYEKRRGKRKAGSSTEEATRHKKGREEGNDDDFVEEVAKKDEATRRQQRFNKTTTLNEVEKEAKDKYARMKKACELYYLYILISIFVCTFI